MHNLTRTTDQRLRCKTLSHGFFGKTGGVSAGIYESLNCGLGSNDERDKVLENRSRLVDALTSWPTTPLVTPYQIHSAKCIAISEQWPKNIPQECDALATATPGLVIAIGTADCGPVLFADKQNGIVAAAHSGWKGAIGGVLENTISAMQSLGAERSNIVAILGPTISQVSYEVGAEFRENFLELSAANAIYFIEGRDPEHFQFNLPAYIVDRLRRCGIANADWTGQCTYLEEDSYFSYRRTTHKQEPDYGRQLAAISII